MSLVLVLFLVVSGVGLLRYVSSRPERSLIVAVSRGGTLGPRKRVLVEGDPIDIGDKLSVRRALLMVTTPNRDVWFKFNPDSQWQYRAGLDSNPSIVIDLDSGQGRAVISSGEVFLKISSVFVRVAGGAVKWNLSPRTPELKSGPGTEISIMDLDGNRIPVDDGNSKTIKIDRVKNSISLDTGHFVERYPSTTGSLIPGQHVLSSVLRSTAQQDVPESLKAVYGHWPRDRWGNIYFYRNRSGTVSIRSGGPDERLFTTDDRLWKETTVVK